MVIEEYSNNDIIRDNIIIVKIKQLFRILIVISHMIIVLHENCIKGNQKFWEFSEIQYDEFKKLRWNCGEMEINLRKNQDTDTEKFKKQQNVEIFRI